MKANKKDKRKFDSKNLIFIALALYLVVLLFAQQSTLDRNRETYKDLQKQLVDAQEENNVLKEEYENIGSDEYIERKARESGLVKSDEVVFVIGNK
ncbi:MAG: hypothetical protein E7388_04390 [Ruminococcaceae bacterium]|nr:hypothetical protein [Oscillospiraceae bacterium]